jgi:hypothetical protein
MEQFTLTEENLQDVTGGDLSNGQVAGITVSSVGAGALLTTATALALRKPKLPLVSPSVSVSGAAPSVSLSEAAPKMASFDNAMKTKLPPIKVGFGHG